MGRHEWLKAEDSRVKSKHEYMWVLWKKCLQTENYPKPTSELANPCKSKEKDGPCRQLEPGILSSGLDLSSRPHSAASQTQFGPSFSHPLA